MELTPEKKAEIDSMTHYQLLYAIRFAPAGDERFQGEVGDYWMKRYGEMKSENPDQAVADSKRMGW